MIDSKLPKDWKDLQDRVAEILGEIGYETDTEKVIKTVRGTAKVDVFAADKTQSPNIVYLCECKHWESFVPKTIIHAFRTVVQDFGANYGIVISKRGFQKGAYETAKNTNIKLVDWFSFQDMFEKKWLPAISQNLHDKYQLFLDCTEPLVSTHIDRKIKQIAQRGKKIIPIFLELRQKYFKLGFRILAFSMETHPSVSRIMEFPLQVEVPVGTSKL